MYIKELKSCPKFISGDGAFLRELLNPRKDKFKFGYSLAHAVVKCGKHTKAHRLKYSEVYYIISGTGRMYIDNKSARVNADTVVYIAPGARQYIANIGKKDLVFLCIVDPAWEPSCEKIIRRCP